ncbi:MAG: hypothetical protein ACYTBJ_22150 [Planctomycetota bacterium]|jgi:hypothetical protein
MKLYECMNCEHYTPYAKIEINEEEKFVNNGLFCYLMGTPYIENKFEIKNCIEIKIVNHQKEVINCPIKEEKKEYDFIVDRYAMKAGVNFNPDRQSVLDVDKDKILMRVSYYNIEKDEFCYEKGVLYFNVEQINHRIKII